MTFLTPRPRIQVLGAFLASLILLVVATPARVREPSAWTSLEHSLGSEDAPVTLIAYLEPTEPLSQQLLYEHWDEFVRRYIEPGHVRLVYRPAPVFSDFSVALALAAACVGELNPDGFWAYVRHWASLGQSNYHQLYRIPSGRQQAEQRLRDTAAQQGKVDRREFEACYLRLQGSRGQLRRLMEQEQIAQVPTFVVGAERRSRLEWQQLTDWLNQVVQAARPPSPATVARVTGEWAGLEQALGNASAPVTMVLYVDFADPASRAFIDEHHDELVKRYVEPGRVRLLYRPAPLGNALSVDLAVVAACLAEQDEQRFWAFYRNFNPAHYRTWFDLFGTEGTFRRVLAQPPVNADASMLMSCYRRENHPARRTPELAAREGVTRTPTVAIGDRPEAGLSWEEITARLDQALKVAEEQSPAPGLAQGHPWAGLERSLGPLSAPVTLVAYIDFFDPRSLAFIERYHQMLQERYIGPGYLRFVYRPAPLADEASVVLAHAAASAAEQGPEHFWRFYTGIAPYRQLIEQFSDDRLGRALARTSMTRRDLLLKLASPVLPGDARRFDRYAYEDCLDMYETGGREAMERARQLATREGIVETPTLILGNERRSGVPERAELVAWLRAHLGAGAP